jgi:hypothetical protein
VAASLTRNSSAEFYDPSTGTWKAAGSMNAYERRRAGLSELVRSLPGEIYRWELGTQRDEFLPATYLIGYPASRLNLPSPAPLLAFL